MRDWRGMDRTMDEQGSGKERPLDRYIAVLESVAEFPDGVSALEIENLLRLPKTTVNRLLKTLLEAELLEISSVKARSYVFGPRLLRLLHVAPNNNWVESVAQRALQVLAEETGETCFLVKLMGREIRSVSTEAPDTPVRTYVVPGSIMPPHATATAKAILAWQPEAFVDSILAQPLEKLTSNSNVDRDALKRELATVREQGYAVERGEHVNGLASIACAVMTAQIGVLYAVGLTGPFDRIIGNESDNHIKALKKTADALARMIVRNGGAT